MSFQNLKEEMIWYSGEQFPTTFINLLAYQISLMSFQKVKISKDLIQWEQFLQFLYMIWYSESSFLLILSVGRFVNVLSESEKCKGFDTLGTVFHNFNANSLASKFINVHTRSEKVEWIWHTVYTFPQLLWKLTASRFIYVLSITVKSAKNLIHWVHFPTNFMKIYQQAGL